MRALAWIAAAAAVCHVPSRSEAAEMIVQVLAREDALSVVQVLDFAHPSFAGTISFPLLATRDGRSPVVLPRGPGSPGGIHVKASPGITADFTGGELRLSLDGSGTPVRVQAAFQVPLSSARSGFVLRATTDLERVRFVTRRTPAYGMQLRPLAPYQYDEESEEDGTWCYLTLRSGLPTGSKLHVAALHLPPVFGPYQVAGLVSLGAALVLFLLLTVRRKRGSVTDGQG